MGLRCRLIEFSSRLGDAGRPSPHRFASSLTGALLREYNDHHALTQPLPLHRLLVALAAADWRCALAGLQACPELRQGAPARAPGPPTPVPCDRTVPPLPTHEPRLTRPVLLHPGPTPPPSPWMRRFTARRWLSDLRLGYEVRRAPDLRALLRRRVPWLAGYLRPYTPLWLPRQQRYRRNAPGSGPANPKWAPASARRLSPRGRTATIP
jgi:hypothetical protein